MPRRKKKRQERYYGKTEDEWKDWGDEFGERMKDWGEDFGKRMEKKEWTHRRSWWYVHFGFLGPLIGSIFGLIGIGLAIIVLRLLNIILASSFILAVTNFLFTYFPLLFAISLFYGYNEYFSKRFWKHHWVVAPITTSVSIVIALWFAVWVLSLLNTVPQSHTIASISSFLSVNLFTFFAIFLVAGYLVVLINRWSRIMWRV